MAQRRTLTLKRETLTELSAADLAGVVGAQGLPTTTCSIKLDCITDAHRTTCLNCE